ncbi:hypothetical protein [Arcobacter sp. LA11]|uniref:hypothetical protein n=1 Tax=Arcobacter sp. LA11 TaxID=1898176 RepID=UPI000932FAF0|nr:hypothetical protein [Arcobacter sp. LA11]
MKKILLSLLCITLYINAHPVSYTIDLQVQYDTEKKEAKISCISNSRNKCGLYSFHLMNKKNNIIKTKRFPFLKKETTVKIDKKPYKIIFFLRKVPAHTYKSFF